MTTMAKSKLLELEIVRAFAILAVLTIHGTSEATVEIPVGSLGQAFYLGINKLSNFAVPLFLLLSGIVLFYRYDGDWGWRQAAVFYRKRIQQIVIPYLIWSLFYYIYDRWMWGPQDSGFSWSEFISLLPWSDAAYHLYFIIIIAQFYVVFPLLMSLCTLFPLVRRYIWVVGLLIQGGFYSYNHWIEPIDHMASLCTTYFLVFSVGASLGLGYENAAAWIKRHIGWLIPLALASGVSFMLLFQIEQKYEISIDGLWYELLFNLYPIAIACVFIWIGRLLIAWKSVLVKPLLSLGVYLVHPAVLTYWRVEVLPVQVYNYHVYTLCGFLLSIVISWLVVYLYGRTFRSLFRRTSRIPSRAK
jgi:peptidoglycan/LPS O-acetylase OafA/YrhL